MESNEEIVVKNKPTKNKKKLPKEGKKLKKKKLFGCKVVKYWFVLNITNPYTTDRIMVKHKSDGILFTLRNSYDDEIKYALPKQKDGGFLLQQSETDPKICLWVGTESHLKKIGYFLIFENEKEANEFYKFSQCRNIMTTPIEENGEFEDCFI